MLKLLCYIFSTYTRIVVTSILIPGIEIIESQLDKKSGDGKLSIVPKILHTHIYINLYEERQAGEI